MKTLTPHLELILDHYKTAFKMLDRGETFEDVYHYLTTKFLDTGICYYLFVTASIDELIDELLKINDYNPYGFVHDPPSNANNLIGNNRIVILHDILEDRMGFVEELLSYLKAHHG